MQTSHIEPDDANTIWSTWIQTAEVLEASREYRFRDEVKELLWRTLGLRRRGVAVEVGCGSGTLSRRLAEWMGPGCLVYGVDRDVNFITYAANRAREERLSKRIKFLQGDALALPLPDSIADATTSYTVIEHIPDHLAFIQEQMRVCKPGGRVSVISVRTEGGFSSGAQFIVEMTEREKELWRPFDAIRENINVQWSVGKCSINTYQLPTLLTKAGLEDVIVDAFCTINALDDARVSLEVAERRLQVEERMYLEHIDVLGPRVQPPITKAHLAELKRLVQARIGRRKQCLLQRQKLWDYRVSLNLIVSGRKSK